MDRIFMAIATGFGLGYLPKAPGTWGTLLALPIHAVIVRLPLEQYWIALGAIFVVAVITAGSAEKIIDHKDPAVVVIDEIIGMLVALYLVPAKPLYMILGFGLFRLFDITKPFPINWVDRRINGGLGIVMDDVIAGIFACVVLQGIIRLLIL
ncbi:MAG: phosphatidylglycerophosphatase A [Proteobacteria bacterium]|nr:phosphatidylglycerophosphatase A [Pseudomonadota bacterium]MBU1710033.1 phosphatidylglycerophosphatase A [Pseudomonadota bacterium]